MEIFQFDYAKIAQLRKMTIEEARLKFRHLELNSADDKAGIQITLYDDEASLTVPYWHDEDAAAVVFRDIWNYLEISAGKWTA